MDLYDQIETTRFVGEEFLTWLWYRSDKQEGHFPLDDGHELELHFDNQLTLEANLAEAERSRLTGGSPSFSPEAKEALRRGKRVAQAKLRLTREGREWVMTVTARTLGISSLKIPAVLSKEDDDRFYERADLIAEADSSLRALYAMFLRMRLDRASWDRELEEIRAWAAEEAS